MTDRSNSNENVFERIDQVCDEFRKQWKAGRRPKLDAFVTRVTGDPQSVLFQKLLLIELRYRGRLGEQPSHDEYLQQFPSFRKAISDTFHQSTSMSADENEDGSKDQLGGYAPTIDTAAANQLGDYQLIGELGRGAFGVVYEAKHVVRANRVALKTLPVAIGDQALSPERLHRFRREFRSLSEINHPNLVGMQSLEVHDGTWFFTMDLIRGVDFLEYVRPQGQRDDERLRTSIAQLVKGIQALHERRIVHRDLKPSNVLIDEDGRVVILDFGLVSELQKASDATISKSATFAGTPRYAAPEQLFGERSEASDWYALGTMIHEAVTGEAPFRGRTMEVMRLKQECDPKPLKDDSSLPSDMASLVDQLLAREPSLRPSAEDILFALSLDVETRLTGSTLPSHGSSASDGDDDLANEWQKDDEVQLIGREDQLSQLEEIHQEFESYRQPASVWITGLSGEGKTTLAEAFLHPLRKRQDRLVLAGRCYDRESIPFKVIDCLIDDLARYLNSLSETEIESMLPKDIGFLAQLFPTLRRVEKIDQLISPASKGLDDRQIHSLAFSALKDLFVAIGERKSIIFFVDDLQWGDADSAEVLHRLFSTPNPPIVLLIGSFRSDEMEACQFLREWAKRFSDLEDKIPHRQVEVSALNEEQCYSLLKNRFGESNEAIRRSAAELYESSKGNPYFLEQLIEGYNAESNTFAAKPLPVVVENRLRNCPPVARSLLDAIAVSGKATDVGEIAAVTGESDFTLETLTHMRSEKLVRLIGSEDEPFVDTYHDKIRETVLAQISAAENQRLHQAFATLIEEASRKKNANADDASDQQIPERVFDLARHYSESGDERAFEYQLLAAQSAIEAFAMDNAYSHLKKAFEICPDQVKEPSRYGLCFMMGQVLSALGDKEESVESFNQACALSDDRAERAGALFALGETKWKLGDYHEAIGILRDAFAELGEHLPSSTIGKLFGIAKSFVQFHLLPTRSNERSQDSQKERLKIAHMYPYYTQIVVHLDVFASVFGMIRGGVVARRAGDDEARILADGFYGFIASLAGVPWIPRRLLKRVQNSYSKISDNRLHIQWYHIGAANYVSADLESARTLLTEASVGLDRADDWRQCMAVHMLRHTYSVMGLADEIVRISNAEIDIGRRTNERMVIAYGLYGLADGLSRQGKSKEPIELCSEAIEILEEIKSVFLVVAYQEMGRVQLQTSNDADAIPYLEKAVKLLFRVRLFEISAPSISLLAESLLAKYWKSQRTKVPSRIGRRVSRLCLTARVFSRIFPNCRAHACRITGRLAVLKGKKQKAIRMFDLAIASAAKSGAQYDVARALIDKSFLDLPNAEDIRDEGLTLLESIGCVLPDAELKTLQIDREQHHNRAAHARD